MFIERKALEKLDRVFAARESNNLIGIGTPHEIMGLCQRFFFGMLERGFYLPPSPFEAAFLSLAHSDEDIDEFLTAAAETMLTIG